MNNTDLKGTMIKYCQMVFYYFQDPVNIPGALYSCLVSTKKGSCPNNVKKKNQILFYNEKVSIYLIRF